MFGDYREEVVSSFAFSLTVVAIVTVLTQSTQIWKIEWIWVIVIGISAYLFELFRSLLTA